METVVLMIHLLVALSLIIVVLLQRSEGGGLGIGGGGGGVMSGRSAATALSKLTWFLGTAFVISSLFLTVLAAQKSSTDSVIDGLETAAPVTDTGSTSPPALGGDLLPPIADDGPATPPAAE